MRADGKPGRHFRNIIAVAHPTRIFFVNALKECAVFIKLYFYLSVLFVRRAFYFAAQYVCGQLHAVANA